MAVTRRKIAGPGRMGSKERIKKSLKGGGGGSPHIALVTEDESLVVRFLTEPEDFYGYKEHYSKESGYVPCTEGECCANAEAGEYPGTKYLANAYVTNKSKVCAVKMTKKLFEQVYAHYDKRGTILDRDYELSRSGSGKNDTVYMASPEPASKMNLKRYADQMLDLEDILLSLLPDDEDDIDEEIRREEKRQRRRPSSTKSRRNYDDDDDYEDDDEDDDEDEDDEPPRKRRAVAKKSTGRRVARRR